MKSRGLSRTASFPIRLKQTNLSIKAGLAILLIFFLAAILAPWIAPYDPTRSIPGARLLAPSGAHLMGTDGTGMDIFSRVIHAGRIDLFIGATAALLSIALGVPLGVFAGYHSGQRGVRGWVAESFMRLMDILQAFPVFVLALALVAALGASVTKVVLAIVFVNAPVFVRLTRAEVLSMRGKAYVDAARVMGQPAWRIAFRHLLPNSLTPSLIQGSVTAGFAVLLTAGLSFVGAGVSVPTPEWGVMISTGASSMITGQWWPATFPGLALGLAVFGFALFGDGLRQHLDPSRRVL